MVSQPKSYSFPKKMRLLNRGQFKSAKANSKSFAGSYVILDISHRNHSTSRLGIIVTKKYGKANLRNRFKRIAREAFRLSQKLLPINTNYIIKPRPFAKQAKTIDIMEELLHLSDIFSKETDRLTPK